MPLWHRHTHAKNTYRNTMHTSHNTLMCFSSPKKEKENTLFPDNGCSIYFNKKKKFKWEREDFIKIKSLLVLLLLELLQQSHLCWADCQGERKSVRGELRVVRQRTHQPAILSLMFSSVFIASRTNWGALYCYWEQRGNTDRLEKIKGDRWERRKEKW